MNYIVRQGTLFEDFETVGDFTASGGGSIASATTYVKTGSNSLKVISASGGNTHATKTINQNMSTAGTSLIWVYIPTLTGLNHVDIFVSSTTDFSKYFSYQRNASVLDEGWNAIIISRKDWANTGSEAWTNTMVRLRVSCYGTASNVATVYFDSLYTGYYSRPKCIFTFDDCVSSGLTQGKLYLDKYRFRATAYIPKSFVDSGGIYATTNDLRALYDAGWDISNHTDSHPYLDQSDQATIEAETDACNTWLISNGFTRNNCHKHYCYPHGTYNSTVTDVMSSRSMLTATTTKRRTQGNYSTAPYTIARYNVDTTNDDLAAMKGWVDDAINKGGTVIFCFHKIITSPAAGETSIADFSALVDYVAARRNLIDVVTISEWYQGLSGGRKSTQWNSI